MDNSIKALQREMGERSIYAFAKIYLPHYLKFPASSFHKELYKLLHDVSHKRNARIAIAAPRASAKSSIVSLIYVIWSICYKKEKYIVLLSNTSSQAENFLSDIKDELEDNESLAVDFPELCETDRKPKAPKWKTNEIITRNDIKVTALGAGQKIRGRKHRQHRPTLVIMDDIENDIDVQSPAQRGKLFSWFTKAILKVGSTSANFILVGTIQHYDSLLARLTNKDQMPTWHKRIYKSIISESSATKLWERWTNVLNNKQTYQVKSGEKAADKFFLDNKEQMLEGTKVLWPEKEDYYTLVKMRAENGFSFASEKQNEPINLKTCIFNPDEFHYWDDKYKEEEDLLEVLGEDLEFYGACDPSLGKGIGKGDYSAIITLVRRKDTGTLYILDADIQNIPLDELIKNIISYCRKRRYRRFGIESIGFQELVADEAKKELDRDSIYTTIEKITNSSNKVDRIRMLRQKVKDGTIRFSRRFRILIDQLKYFPKGAHDDGPDALEMAFKVSQEPEDDTYVGIIRF